MLCCGGCGGCGGGGGDRMFGGGVKGCVMAILKDFRGSRANHRALKTPTPKG